MNWPQLIASLKVNPDPYTEIGIKQVLFTRTTEDGIHLIVDTNKFKSLSEEAKEVINACEDASFLLKMEVYMMCKTLGEGPKVFRPTADQMFALERMNLNLTVADYDTPFELIVVELPKDYAEARMDRKTNVAHCSQLLFQKEKGLFVHNLMFDNTALKGWARIQGENEIESWFDDDEYNEHDFSDLPTTTQEFRAEITIRRAVLNYCLLLDEVGVKQHGPQSPNQYNQLVKWCQKNNKHTARNKIQLQAQPITYGINKETALVRTVSSADKLEPVPTGRRLTPHSRRGYYRMQRFGPRNADKKRIRIPPTFVNAEFLYAETRTYTT